MEGKNTAGTLMGWWEKENCVYARTTDKALPYLMVSHPDSIRSTSAKPLCPKMPSGCVWVSNEWSAWSETESLAMPRNGCPLPLSEGDHAIVTIEQRQPDIP